MACSGVLSFRKDLISSKYKAQKSRYEALKKEGAEKGSLPESEIQEYTYLDAIFG